ncbi:MAG: DUF3501 family protein [Gammaproteobacteria bacterium]|jgi:Protein of unknown function (DUF3501)|nr:DUF3501 family protein [Gammaproteobacteria bacterium]
MKKLTHEDLMGLEVYARNRQAFREKVMAHKKARRVAIGDHAALYFEDALTMQYQVQEMLRIEKIFEPEGIQEELDVYNALIPDGSNWKATFMIEYNDVEERKQALAKMRGIDKKIWIRVGDCDPVNPIANEDLDRETEDKTSAVHFMRFELTPDMVKKAKAGAKIAMGIDHSAYQHSLDPVPDNIRKSLVNDLS